MPPKSLKSSYTAEQLRASIAKPNWIVRRASRGDTTSAGNPCQTRFEIAQYFRCYPAMLLLVPLAFLLMMALGWWKDIDWRISLAVSAVVAIGVPFQIVTTMMKKFATGNVNPGFVLDDSHVAVFADLRAGGSQPRNAVKVIYAPLSKMSGGPYRKGDRVTTTCLYAGPPDASGAWTDVHPFPVAAGSTDPVALARLEMSLSDAEWLEARQHVDQIGSSKQKLKKFWQS